MQWDFLFYIKNLQLYNNSLNSLSNITYCICVWLGVHSIYKYGDFFVCLFYS